MRRYLNNLLKGLLTAFVIICVGGFIFLNIKVTPTNAMVLVSSSLVNSITGESSNKENDINEIEKEEIKEETLEVFEDNLEEEKIEINKPKEEIEKEEIKTNDTSSINSETNIIEENKEEEVLNNQENTTTDTVVDEQIKQEEAITVKGEYAPNLEVSNTIEPLATYYGKMTGYGPDCYGCSGITASGRNVLNGNIYYEDQTFGNIRIVAGDRSIPFGSIIKITGTNVSNEPVIAIVLDRGGMIGFQEGKHSYFDLLFESEQAASLVGRQDATFELLRSGY